MIPGDASQKVTVNADVLPANAASVVENRSVTETPINGRSFVSLIEGIASGQRPFPAMAAIAALPTATGPTRTIR